MRTPMVQKNPSSHTDAALNLATAITKATFKCAAGVEAVGEKQIERHRVDGWAVHARTARGDKPQAVRGGASGAALTRRSHCGWAAVGGIDCKSPCKL